MVYGRDLGAADVGAYGCLPNDHMAQPKLGEIGTQRVFRDVSQPGRVLQCDRPGRALAGLGDPIMVISSALSVF